VPINWRFIDDEDGAALSAGPSVEPVGKSNPVKGLRWPPGAGEDRPKIRSWNFGNDGPAASFDEYQNRLEAKQRAQAQARARLGLPPADFVDYGCEGEPKPPDTC